MVVDPNIKTRNAIEALCEYNPQVSSVYAVSSPSEARVLLPDRHFDYAVVRTDIYEESGYDFAEQMIFGGFVRAVSFIGDETGQKLPYMPLGFFPGKSLRTEVPEMIAKYRAFQNAEERFPVDTENRFMPKSRLLLVEARFSETGGWNGIIGSPDGKTLYSFRGWDGLLLKIDDICDTEDFPQRDRKVLCFSELRKRKSSERTAETGCIEKAEGTADTGQNERSGTKQTDRKKLNFKIQITFRSGGSMQGVAVWLGRDLTVRFVSALQLLRLFTEAAERLDKPEPADETEPMEPTEHTGGEKDD